MGRVLRGVVRLFILLAVALVLFGMASAVAAIMARRRLESTEDPASNDPTVVSIFGDERFLSRAPALRGGRVITWFASNDVDLRGATLDPSSATMEVRTVYGATQIAVPEGWRVRSHLVSIFGGTELSLPEPDVRADAPLLELRGFTLFGAARVTTSPDAAWSGADHEGEALPPAADRAGSVE